MDPFGMNSEARHGREPTSILTAELETTLFVQVVMVQVRMPLHDRLDFEADTTDLALA